jgi:hypothetical protein
MSNYHQVAVLTRLRVEMPQMTKTDKRATEAAELAYGASKSGKYRKDLYPKHLIDPITQFASSARAYMYSQTRPSPMTDAYYLPNVRVPAYLDAMGKYELGFQQNVTVFLNNLSNVMLKAQEQQGGLFDPTEYPDVSDLAKQFIFQYPIWPVGNLRDVVQSDLDEAILSRMQADQNAERDGLIKDAFSDLRKQVCRIIKQTSVVATTNKKGELVERSGKIYDTLTEDIAHLTRLLQDMDFGGSEELSQIAADVGTHLTLPADALRNDIEVCRITHDKAQQILKAMEAFA